MQPLSQVFPCSDPHCNLAWIGSALCFKGSPKALEQYVTGLIDHMGFPKPLPHLKHGGGIAEHVSYKKSEWLRIGVLEWLNGYLPPEASDALLEKERLANAATLDERAGSLQLVGRKAA